MTDPVRAYALLTIEKADPDTRLFNGIATTPTPDSVGDVIEPLGVTYHNPLPLLLHHDRTKPVGQVTFAAPTTKGIAFTGAIPIVSEPGTVKTRVDEAWHSIKARLITGVSIGLKAAMDDVKPLKSGGFHVLKSEVFELSLVTIPSNRDATIVTVKALDLAAIGRHSPGATGPLPLVRVQKDARAMTIPEQITQWDNKRAASSARMNDLMTKAAAESVTLDAAQTEEYDTLAREVQQIDAHLVRLRDLEKASVVQAARIVAPGENPAAVTDLRGGNGNGPEHRVITVKPNVPKGTAFTRGCMCLAGAKGDSYAAIERARTWHDSTPEVELMVKAAVAPGTTTDATWAGPLVVVKPLVDEFLELLRPRTLLGPIPVLRQVPFNISVPSQTTGGTYGWVGQNKPKPVTKADYATVSLGFAKAAGIIVLTEELVMLSTPSAEALVREEMIAGMGAFLDQQFNDPAVAAVVGVNPASITNGAGTAAATGVTAAAAKADLSAAVATFTAANVPLDGSCWLMSDSNAFGLALSVNALGQPLFPGMNVATGTGSLFGMPVIISNNTSNRIILMHAPSILYADEGGVRIDVSREASVQMDSAPADPADATTVYISLWQKNLVGLKAERFITWLRARTAAVRVITAAAYNGT